MAPLALIRAARQAAGMTNAQLAAYLGVSTFTLRAWGAPETSRCRRTMPAEAAETLSRLAGRKP